MQGNNPAFLKLQNYTNYKKDSSPDSETEKGIDNAHGNTLCKHPLVIVIEKRKWLVVMDHDNTEGTSGITPRKTELSFSAPPYQIHPID
ncbi:MAG: hypothetical protein IT216_01135 [Saprospiraceae bacterium]|nr:hypothetical protein [Saprospiraceae bacterium]